MKLFISILLVAFGLLAQESEGKRNRPSPLERYERMTPQQRRRMLDRMPADRRAEFERRMERLRATDPRTRDRMRRDYERMQRMSPEEREQARKAVRAIADLPLERRREVGGAVQTLRRMSPERRAEAMNSSRFTLRFNEDEQQMVREALSALGENPQN